MNKTHSDLIETGLVDVNSLAKALIHQLKNTPPSLSLLFEKGLITPEQVIEILELQEQESLSLKQACDALELWNEEFQDAIIQAQTNPLSESLLATGAIDPKLLLEKLEAISSNTESSNGSLELIKND